MNEKLSLGTIDELMETLKKFQNHFIFKSLNLRINIEDLKEKIQEQFSSNEFKKRETHFLKDCFTSYKDLYSKYEVIEFYLGFLLDIGNPSFNPMNFRKKEFTDKNKYIRMFRDEIENSPKWKIFWAFGIGRPRDIRNLEAHEELSLENNIIRGWLKEPDPPIEVKEFNEYRLLLIILLWKVYDIFGLSVAEGYVDNLIQF